MNKTRQETQEKAERYKVLHEIIAKLPENELVGVLNIADLSEGKLGKFQIGSMIKHNPSLFGLVRFRHMGADSWQPLYLKPVKDKIPTELPVEVASDKDMIRIASYINQTGFCESPSFLTFNRASFLLEGKFKEYERFPRLALREAARRRVKSSSPETDKMSYREFDIFVRYQAETDPEIKAFVDWAKTAQPAFDSFVQRTGLPVAKLYGIEALVYHPQLIKTQ